MTTALATQNTANVGHMGMIPANTTDTTLVNMWIAKAKSQHTKTQYKRAYAQFADAVGKPLRSINLADLQDWAAGLEGKPNTVKVKIAAIKSLFSFAIKTGYLAINPATMIETPTVPDDKRDHVISEIQIFRMLEAANTPRDAAIIHCLYNAGCRVSELLDLNWENVKPIADDAAYFDIKKGKHDQQRDAGINADAYARLLAIKPLTATDADPVFVSNRGSRLTRTVVFRMIADVAEKAKIGKNVSPHWFRHSHATHAIKNGANPIDVQKQLGHSSLAVTTGYGHSDRFSANSLAL